MPKKPDKENPKCPFCNGITVKNGLRKNKLRAPQRYLCKSCKQSFTFQHQSQKSKTHSIKTILTSISDYNLGMPLRKQKIPSSTIHNWVKNFNLPLNRLRDRVKGKNIDEIIIKKRFIHHQQPFLYQYHKIKLNFAAKFPGLIKYLKYLYLPKGIFDNSQRISKYKETPTKGGDRPGVVPYGVVGRTFCEAKWPSPAIGLVGVSESNKKLKNPPANVGVSKSKTNHSLIKKNNYATKLAQLALTITKDNKERHNIIENFMLINDTSTIATEIPIYFKPSERKIKDIPTSKLKDFEETKPLTGHIDILQIRYNKIYILDYKPEPVNKQQTISQLRLYKKALSRRTFMPKNKIKLAFFNDKGYYEIK